MKILVIDLGSKLNSFGGQARIAEILYRKLARYFGAYYLGYETGYIKSGRGAIILDRGIVGLEARKMKISESWIVRFLYNLLIVNRLRDVDRYALFEKVSKINPDVIITSSIQDINLLKFFRKKGLEFKSVYIDHGSVSTTIDRYLSKEGIPLTIGTGVDSLSLEEKKRKFFGFFDMNVALNNEQFEKMYEYTEKVILIPNGMDVNVRKNMGEERAFKSKYNISNGDFVVLYVGRMFDRQKNVSTLIKAFKNIRDGKMKLLLVGDGPSLKDYKELAGGDDRIIFTGSMGDRKIGNAYRSSDLFVLPSFWEGFSLTIIEAASHSLPLILSEPAYIEDLRSEDIGNIASFYPSDWKRLKSIIELFRKDPESRKRAINASMKIKKKFTESSMIENYRMMLERLVE
jgi:glycosyltransferase involved in cell wall biosynthesis